MEKDPSATLRSIAGGYCLSRSLHVVANLGIADALGKEPRTVSELATDVGANADALHRVLRLLAAHDVFAIQDEMVRHTPASDLLRSDHAQSVRASVQMFGLPLFWTTYGEMEHAVRTGTPATTKAFPEGFWGYLAERPEAGRILNTSMEAKSRGAIQGILATYDFSPFQSIADIGGGNGHLLRAILDTVPAATGVLFDLPQVIEELGNVAHERLVLQAGDFFRDPLPSCDVYVLMEVIHDWGDEDSIAILRAIRQVSLPGATVLLIETILSDDPGPDRAKVLDIHMLTLLGGRQRTQAEYDDLLSKAGFQFTRQINTGAGFVILEAKAA